VPPLNSRGPTCSRRPSIVRAPPPARLSSFLAGQAELGVNAGLRGTTVCGRAEAGSGEGRGGGVVWGASVCGGRDCGGESGQRGPERSSGREAGCQTDAGARVAQADRGRAAHHDAQHAVTAASGVAFEAGGLVGARVVAEVRDESALSRSGGCPGPSPRRGSDAPSASCPRPTATSPTVRCIGSPTMSAPDSSGRVFALGAAPREPAGTGTGAGLHRAARHERDQRPRRATARPPSKRRRSAGPALSRRTSTAKPGLSHAIAPAPRPDARRALPQTCSAGLRVTFRTFTARLRFTAIGQLDRRRREPERSEDRSGGGSVPSTCAHCEFLAIPVGPGGFSCAP